MEDRLRSVESDMAVLKRDCADVKADMTEFWRFRSTVSTFMDTLTATQAEQAKQQEQRHKQNSWKLNFIGVCVAVATAVIMLIGLYVSVKESQHAKNSLVSGEPAIAYMR